MQTCAHISPREYAPTAKQEMRPKPGNLVSTLAALPNVDPDFHGPPLLARRNSSPGYWRGPNNAVGWGLDRRVGLFYPLQGPRPAIDDQEIDQR